MNIGQQEKLEGLINTSAILNPQERGEWLGLLGLMNTKQLNELEKILSSNIHPSENIKQQPAAPVSSALVTKASVLQPEIPSVAPKLSHIMNLPRLDATAQKNENSAGIKFEVKESKPKLSFSQKLKSLLSEKELPAPDAELDLPAAGKFTVSEQKPVAHQRSVPPPVRPLQRIVPETKPAPLPKAEVKLPPAVPMPPKAVKPVLPVEKIEEIKPQPVLEKPKQVLKISEEIPKEKSGQEKPVALPVMSPKDILDFQKSAQSKPKEAPVAPVQPQIVVMPVTNSENLAAQINKISGIKQSEPASTPAVQPTELKQPEFMAKPGPPTIQKPSGLELSTGINSKVKGSLAQLIDKNIDLSKLNGSVNSPASVGKEDVGSINWQLKQALQNAVGKNGEAGVLSNAQKTDKPKSDNITSLSENMAANKTVMHLQQASPKIVLNPGPKLESLAELTNLNPKVLVESDLGSVVDKVKKLCGKFGYHEVVFNIEKSPLFKEYIKTGLELLNKQTSFEKLLLGEDAKKYLNRKEFEKIADLLVQIQAN